MVEEQNILLFWPMQSEMFELCWYTWENKTFFTVKIGGNCTIAPISNIQYWYNDLCYL